MFQPSNVLYFSIVILLKFVCGKRRLQVLDNFLNYLLKVV